MADNAEEQQEQQEGQTLTDSLKQLNSRQSSTDNQVSSHQKISNGYRKLRNKETE